MMNEVERKVLAALIELEKAVEQIPTANPKPDLAPIFTKIDNLTKELPLTTDRQLIHFLQRKSYQKARLFLQEQETGSVPASS